MSAERCVPFKITVAGQELEAFMKKSDYECIINSLNIKLQTGYERVDGDFYYVCEFGSAVEEDGCTFDEIAEACYKAANYYSSEEVAESNGRAETLMRQLRRFAVEHRENELDWNAGLEEKWSLFYDYECKRLNVWDSYKSKEAFSIYFDTKETAELAIETFHDELIWYFTEYKDSL